MEEYLTSGASNQPHLLGLPVVAPNSAPAVRSISPSESGSSVGNGPIPTRVVYAFTIPTIVSILFGGIPVPVHAPPEVGLEEVTYGYVPWSTSRRAPCADRKSTRLNSSHLGISYAVFC